MNVFQNKNFVNLNESLDEKMNRLVESFNRSQTLDQFLMENGKSEENTILYHFMVLNESQDENNRFTFENGIYIPGLGSRATGRLTLNNIAEKAESENDFVNEVSKIICEDKLMFTPTENDINNLKESFNKHAKSMLV